MPGKAVAVVVLVCPQCGKKYKGDANKPDARYQCPADQSTLIRLDTEAASALRQAKTIARDQAAGDAAGTGPDSDGSGPPPAAAPPEFVDANAPPPPPAEPKAEAYTVPYGNSPIDNGAGTIATPAPPPPSATPAPRRTPSQPRPGGTSILSGFEQRRSVVATLERLGGTNAVTGERVPVFKYETKSKLGQGGMGEVFKVLDRDLRREVAMKMLRPQSAATAEEPDLLRFIKEAQATGRLEHPNIVPVHDLGVDGEGRIYFTLKYVQGVSLKDVIRGRRDNTALEDQRKFRDVYSARQMVEILISVCNAVAYAHSKDIIHRDLKPDNVMLGKFGEVLVMDWGLAKILTQQQADASSQESFLDLNLRSNLDSNMTLEGAIAGTPAYMSPEQAGGRISELDQRTDVYSLGSMLYEILSGEPPFKGTTALEVVRMVTEGPPPPLSVGVYGFRPIPRELKAICEKAMAHDSAQRYFSAEQLRDDLQHYLEDQPVSSCPDTPTQRAVKWVKRNRHRVTTSVSTAIAVLAIVAGCWYGYREFTVARLLHNAQVQAGEGKKRYEGYKNVVVKLRPDDPYRMSMQAAAQSELATIYREKLNLGIDSARKALDLSPESTRARQFLADSYMELWRLALAESNTDLMNAYSAEVMRYAPDPIRYELELKGMGKMEVSVDPPNADIYLFRFETLHSTDKDGNALPSRLVPVPFDPATGESDAAFLDAEAKQSQEGAPIPDASHTIFKLDPTPKSRLGSGNVNIDQLPPGSYMLLLLSLGHAETRVPFNMERQGVISRHVIMPSLQELPAGFFYVDGGPAWIGGNSANALPHQLKSIAPFLIYHDEITMGDYGEYLRSIGKDAANHIPRDFGKPLAVLTSAGLAPADGSDAEKFSHSAVRGVTLNDALAYVAWRSQRDGIAYRLPTEYEWESACRGADGRKFSWGNSPGNGLAIVTQGYGDAGTSVSWKWQDYKDESPWGVHNLAGGVAEWTSSLYKEKAAGSDPVYGQHTIKGDAWSLPPTGLECAFRTSGQPDYFHPTIGFRIAADFPPKRIGNPQPQPDTTADATPIIGGPAPKVVKPKTKPMSHAEQVIHNLGLDR